MFLNLLFLLSSPDRYPVKLLLLSHCPLTPWFPLRCPLKPGLPSRCPWKLQYPSRGPSSSGCSIATENCQHHESCHFSCTSVTDAVGTSKQTSCFPLRKTTPFTFFQTTIDKYKLMSMTVFQQYLFIKMCGILNFTWSILFDDPWSSAKFSASYLLEQVWVHQRIHSLGI